MLHKAVRRNRAACTRFLLRLPGIDVNSRDAAGTWNPLLWGVFVNSAALRVLLDAADHVGLVKTATVGAHRRDYAELTAVGVAHRRGHDETRQLLLDAGCPFVVSSDGSASPLLDASAFGSIERLRELLPTLDAAAMAVTVSSHARGGYAGLTAVGLARMMEREQRIVDLLVSAGCDEGWYRGHLSDDEWLAQYGGGASWHASPMTVCCDASNLACNGGCKCVVGALCLPMRFCLLW